MNFKKGDKVIIKKGEKSFNRLREVGIGSSASMLLGKEVEIIGYDTDNDGEKGYDIKSEKFGTWFIPIDVIIRKNQKVTNWKEHFGGDKSAD